jgi:hypothetical protein
MSEVLPFPGRRARKAEPSTLHDVVDMMRHEAEFQSSSHLFAVMVNGDGTVSSWSFVGSAIDSAPTLKSLMASINALQKSALQAVPEEV